VAIDAAQPARARRGVHVPKVRGRYGYAYLFMLPAVLLLLGLTVWPLVRTFFLSVQNVNLVRPGSEFVGLENFRMQLADRTLFWPAVWHSLVWTVGSVGGEYLLGRLRELEGHPHVGNVRGKGLMLMVEVVADTATKAKFDPSFNLGVKLTAATRARGLIVRGTNDGVAIAPPLTIQKAELDLIAEAVAAAIDEATG